MCCPTYIYPASNGFHNMPISIQIFRLLGHKIETQLKSAILKKIFFSEHVIKIGQY